MMNFMNIDRAVDVVFCIDATGNMCFAIDRIKNDILSFDEKLRKAAEEDGRCASRFRFKIIAFRDYADKENVPMLESAFFSLPEENARLQQFLGSIQAVGGGDVPENALEALALAMKSDWTQEGDRRRHIIVMLTDAPALPLNARADCPGYPDGMPKDLEELYEWWEIGNDACAKYQPKAGRLIAFAPKDEPWEEMTVWDRYWWCPVTSGDSLRDVEDLTVTDLLTRMIGRCH